MAPPGGRRGLLAGMAAASFTALIGFPSLKAEGGIRHHTSCNAAARLPFLDPAKLEVSLTGCATEGGFQLSCKSLAVHTSM